MGSRHGRAQLPGQDVAREVIEHSGQVEPAPADDLEVGEVGLPKLVWSGSRISEAIGRLHQDEGRAGDQAMALQEPINGGVASENYIRAYRWCRPPRIG